MSAVAHRPAVRWSGHVTATLHELASVRDRLTAALSSCGWGEVEAFRVLVCADEAAANALSHGSRAGDPIQAAFRVSSRTATVVYGDPGSGAQVTDIRPQEPDARCEHGRGLMLIHALSDRTRLSRRGRRTVVAMGFSRGRVG